MEKSRFEVFLHFNYNFVLSFQGKNENMANLVIQGF